MDKANIYKERALIHIRKIIIHSSISVDTVQYFGPGPFFSVVKDIFAILRFSTQGTKGRKSPSCKIKFFNCEKFKGSLEII